MVFHSIGTVVLMTFTFNWNVNYNGYLNKRKFPIDEFIEELREMGDKFNSDPNVIKTKQNSI